jgi:hypothetical protein
MTRRKLLEQRLKALGERLGRDLELSVWAPGDGWTRYQVYETATGRDVFGNHRVYTIKEIEIAIKAAHYTLDILGANKAKAMETKVNF